MTGSPEQHFALARVELERVEAAITPTARARHQAIFWWYANEGWRLVNGLNVIMDTAH